ncbi:MAG: hypothetical protein M4579_002464 [Chaenotheca gracillima]|nr:MAG: hypothetical protein M4579_002464 [Chaenotheca gracillima]
MAAVEDPRSLLRAARASRRINHPQAIYSKAGSLKCAVCDLAIKSDALWEGHLRSKQHKLNGQRSNGGPAPVAAGSKKRKADDSEEEEGDHKRARENTNGEVSSTASKSIGMAPSKAITEPELPKIDGNGKELSENLLEPQEGPTSNDISTSYPIRPPSTRPIKESAGSTPLSAADKQPNNALAAESAPEVDEDEWAAFEREVAATEAESKVDAATDPSRSALTAPATYSAPAVSAAELARQSSTDRSGTRRNREEELEEEKEDATRKLEEEFEEMEGLEERVRALKERREKLRAEREHKDLVTTGETGPTKVGSGTTVGQDAGEAEDDDESDDDDDEDDWGFR